MCFCKVLGAPFQRFEVYDDVINEAEIIDAGVPLPGNKNLSEKSLPVLQLFVPREYWGDLYGNKNLGERIQVPSYGLPGLENLKEKFIPAAGIFKSRHLKSEIDKFDTR